MRCGKRKKLSELTAALRLGDDKTKTVVGAGDIHSAKMHRQLLLHTR